MFEISICKFKDSFGKLSNSFLPINADTTKISRLVLGDANRIARLNTFALRARPIILHARVCLELAYKTFTEGLTLFDPDDQVGMIFFDKTGFDTDASLRTEPLVSRSETLALFISVLNTVCIHAVPLALRATQNIVNKALNYKKIDSKELLLTLFGVNFK